ncbi:uncharacterized protein [Montipora foliosa]|uniref:uncharacterized protein isoform X5 n=1 Tax=Montipora foliosa TaxID=591990 RepID=UPI0035F1FDEB
MATEEEGDDERPTGNGTKVTTNIKRVLSGGVVIVGPGAHISQAKSRSQQDRSDSEDGDAPRYCENRKIQRRGIRNSRDRISLFLKDVKDSMADFDRKNGPLWQEEQEVICKRILPYLKEMWNDSSSRLKTYEALAVISFSRSSPKVVQATLRLFSRLMFAEYNLKDDDMVSMVDILLVLEEVRVRLSITSPVAFIGKQGYNQRKLWISLYTLMLTVMAIQKSRGQLCVNVITIRKMLSDLQGYLKKYCDRQDETGLKCSLEIVDKCITFILSLKCPKKDKINRRVKRLLNECQEKENYENIIDIELKRAGRNIKKNWFVPHCVIFYLFGEVHKEERKLSALTLLRRVIDAYIGGGGAKDPKFCFQVLSVLYNVATTHISPANNSETRKKAEEYLREFITNEEVLKNQYHGEMMKTDFYQVLSTPGKEMPMIMESLLKIDTAYSHGDRYSQLQGTDSSSESRSYGNTEEEDTAYSHGDRYSQLQDSSSESQSYGNTEEEDTAYSHGDCYSQLQDNSSIESQSYGLTEEELIQERRHQEEDCSFQFASPPITSVSQTYSNLEEMASTTAEPEYYNTQGSTTVDGIRSEEPSFSGSFSDNKHYMIPKVKASTTAEPEYCNTQGSTTVDGTRSEEPSFSGSFSDNKHYMIPKVKDRAAVTQRLQSRRDERIPEHWETLLQLKNVNIGLNCAMYSKSRYRFMEIVSPNTPFGNLKDYVLDGRCHSYVMIKILSQLASAQTYLHENHIVHGDFRSEHVNVLGPCQGFKVALDIPFQRSVVMPHDRKLMLHEIKVLEINAT